MHALNLLKYYGTKLTAKTKKAGNNPASYHSKLVSKIYVTAKSKP